MTTVIVDFIGQSCTFIDTTELYLWNQSINQIDKLRDCFSDSGKDIIDEAIYYFKANVFFRNYEIKVTSLCCSFWLLFVDLIFLFSERSGPCPYLHHPLHHRMSKEASKGKLEIRIIFSFHQILSIIIVNYW